MNTPATNHQTVTAQDKLPRDLWGHLQGADPRSFEFRADFGALNELAHETGYAALTLEDIFPPLEAVPPKGYKSELIIPGGAEVPTDQFEGVILSFAKQEPKITTDLHRLVTDSGQPINLIDLRSLMTAEVRRGGPSERVGQESLDSSFYADLKFMLSSRGQLPRRSVSGASKTVGYTRQGSNLERAYWMPVTLTDSDGTITVARIADARDKPSEKALYQSVLGLNLQI